MTDSIIYGVLTILTAMAVVHTVKHFARKGGCCGSSGYKPRRKKLKNVLYQKSFRVEGMHCDNCRTKVEAAINDMDGLAGRVDLKKGLLIVSYAEAVADDFIIARVQRAGYRVVG